MSTFMRIARPTDRLSEVARFYGDGVGLEKNGEFENQGGFDGVIFHHPESGQELEFTQSTHYEAGNAPTPENLVVFFFGDERRWREAVARLDRHGHERVEPYNPFWRERGVMFADPDGYRVVLSRGLDA